MSSLRSSNKRHPSTPPSPFRRRRRRRSLYPSSPFGTPFHHRHPPQSMEECNIVLPLLLCSVSVVDPLSAVLSPSDFLLFYACMRFLRCSCALGSWRGILRLPAMSVCRRDSCVCGVLYRHERHIASKMTSRDHYLCVVLSFPMYAMSVLSVDLYATRSK